MPESSRVPTIIDNLATNTLAESLKRLLPQGQAWDVATGTFEIGSLLALDGIWQPLHRIRILMGDETSARTRRELMEALARQTDDSIEAQKERDDGLALTGLAAVRHALDARQIAVRVYGRAKFHAKAHFIDGGDLPVDFAVVGSSNFTEPGLNRNLELNLFTTDPTHIAALRDWYERVWQEAQDARPDLMAVIERHLRAYTPFEVWAKALYEFFQGRQAPETEWESRHSVMYPVLSRYQRDGYLAARRIAEQRGGALLCDGVGLGKTFIGLMLLEYHLHRGDRILLIVPKSARESVWQRNLERYLYRDYRMACREHLKVHNHTDFGREGTVSEDLLDYYRDYADVILVDEAHHFRTPSANRSVALTKLARGKKKTLYFLTATPVNNSLLDLYHLINYLALDQPDYFRDLGIHNLRHYFTTAEKALEEHLHRLGGDIQTAAQNEDILRTDHLLRELVIQRSRAYVQGSERAEADSTGGAARLAFPDRKKPRVIRYSLKKVYADLYGDLTAAFGRTDPLLSLAAYNTEAFRRGQPNSELLNRNRQVMGLVRTLLLKRLESSYVAFQGSLEDLLRKMAFFLESHNQQRWEDWKTNNAAAWQIVQQHWHERRADEEADAETEEDDDLAADEFALPCLNADTYDIDALLTAVEQDMALLVQLLQELFQHLSPQTDDKLQQLLVALRTDPLLTDQKVVIFTEFRDTARYLWRQLRASGFGQVEEIDSTRKVDRERVIKRFAPYYNCTETERAASLADPIRILISTDVLSEGLNLQDASRIINYDLHWNPVRLMQRIGRVDRRLDPAIEAALGRGNDGPVHVHVYNFLPPDDLEQLLALFRTLTGKLLRISKTLGIEAPVLTPDDDFAALRLFNETYLGHKSVEEELHEELQAIRREHPELYEQLSGFPRRVFSGKAAITGMRGLFCAYRFPEAREGVPGELRWYFRLAGTGEIWELNHLGDIANAIRATAETPRVTSASAEDLKSWRQEIEQKCVRPHLRDRQAVAGQRATLACWMEVS